jgi:DNA-binding transcriptional ArsR family regulator
MRKNIGDRDIAFRHEDGCLVRTVTGSDGRTYTHRCSMEVFEKVAWILEETPAEGNGIAIGEIAAAGNLPHTQVDVTLAFLYERGIIDRRHRRNYPASTSVHLDAMVEWHALREETKPA